MGYSKRTVPYGTNRDEYAIVESLTDEMRFALCMKLYKSFDTIDKLEDSLKKNTLNKINQTY